MFLTIKRNKTTKQNEAKSNPILSTTIPPKTGPKSELWTIEKIMNTQYYSCRLQFKRIFYPNDQTELNIPDISPWVFRSLECPWDLLSPEFYEILLKTIHFYNNLIVSFEFTMQFWLAENKPEWWVHLSWIRTQQNYSKLLIFS